MVCIQELTALSVVIDSSELLHLQNEMIKHLWHKNVARWESP